MTSAFEPIEAADLRQLLLNHVPQAAAGDRHLQLAALLTSDLQHGSNRLKLVHEIEKGLLLLVRGRFDIQRSPLLHAQHRNDFARGTPPSE